MLNSRLWALLPILMATSPKSRGGAVAHALLSRPPQSPPLRAIFSDIDGTLVHYAKDFTKHGIRLLSSDETALTAIVENENGDRRKCRLLPSSTMGPACISERTIELVDELRAEHGVMFCVVTAARKSTMVSRWDLLPRCDAHVCESGSRIWVNGIPDEVFANQFVNVCGPMNREVEGADERMEPLWQFYRKLRERVPGLTMDSRSYYGMFRVGTNGDVAIEAALHDIIRTSLPDNVSCATNLGKYDFYPSVAGKGGAVSYLQKLFGISKSETAALFDDDNDLPMAEQCGIHMLPGLTSESVKAAAICEQPSWYVANTVGQGVFAIEECLEVLLDRARVDSSSSRRQHLQEQQLQHAEDGLRKSDDIEELLREVKEATMNVPMAKNKVTR